MIRIAQESKIAEPAVEEVFGGQSADLLMIGHHSRYRQVGEDSRDVDHRRPEPFDGLGQIDGEDVGDQPFELERSDRLDGIRVGSDGREGPLGPRRGERADTPHDVPVIGQAVAENQADPDQAVGHAPRIKRDASSEQIAASADGNSGPPGVK